MRPDAAGRIHPEKLTPDLFHNEKPVTSARYITDEITDHATAFIKAHRDQPFFLEVSYNAPHWPYQVPDRPSVARDSARHLTPFDDSTSTRADYAAMLEARNGPADALRAAQLRAETPESTGEATQIAPPPPTQRA